MLGLISGFVFKTRFDVSDQKNNMLPKIRESVRKNEILLMITIPRTDDCICFGVVSQFAFLFL